MKELINTLISLSILIAIVLLVINIKTAKKIHRQDDNFSAVLDSTVKTINKLDEVSYKVATLETNNLSLLKNIKTKDKEIARLKELVSKYERELKNNGSVTVFTDSLIYYDTIPIIDGSFKLNNKWINFKGSISDSLKFNFQTSNQYSVILGYEGKWYQRKKPFTLITNLNPYSSVNTIRSYKVKVNDRNWRFNITGGYGVTYQNNNFYTGPSVVAGFGYTF